MTPHRLHMRIAPILTAAVLITFLIPVSVAAHAALDVPTPAVGTTVQGTPTEVAGTFTQDLETDGSSLQLRNGAGEVIATGGVDPANERRMVITALPDLAPGDYEVRWTTLSAEDGELDRDTWTFTVVAAASPTVAPTPALTATPDVTPSAAPSSSLPVAATPGGLPSPSPGPIATEGQNPDPDPAVAAADVILPIVAGLAIVLIAAGALLRRRGRSGPSGRQGPTS